MATGVVVDSSRLPQLSIRSGSASVDRAGVIVAVLTVLGAVLRFTRLGHQSFWYDESFTALLVRHSPGQMLGLLPQTELTPPLYYLLAWPWARVFGNGEAGLRSLSALAGVATIPAMYGAGATLISRRVGLSAAALTACSPMLVWYSQEARSYALLILLATLSLMAFAAARRPRPTWRRLAGWGLAAALTLATHYYGALLVVGEALGLLWVHRRNYRAWLTVAGVGAFGGALLPLALSQSPKASWIAPWRLDLRLQQIPTQFLLGTGAPARMWLELAGAAAVLLAVVLLVARGDSTERQGALVAGALAGFGLLMALALVAAGVDELITRNVLVVLVALIVLVSAGLGAQRSGALGLIGVVVICTIGLVAVLDVASDPTLQRPDWRALARSIGADRRPAGGRAFLLERDVFLMPLALDIPGLHFLRPHGERVTELDVVATSTPRDGWFCWWGSGCNLLGSKLDTRIRIRGFQRAGRVLHVNQFWVLRLRSAVPRRITSDEIARALARAPIRVPRYRTSDIPRGFRPPYGYGLFVQTHR